MTHPTFDFFPRGTRLIVTDRIERRMHEELAAGGSAGDAYEEMEAE